MWDEESERPCDSCTLLIQGSAIAPVVLVTDAQGTATTKPISPGDYLVVLEKVQSLGSVVKMSGGDNARAAQVVAGGVTEVRFGQQFARVRVRFDATVPANWVLDASSASASGTTHEERLEGGFLVRKPDGEPVALNLGDGNGTQIYVGLLAADEKRSTLTLPLPPTRVIGVLARDEEPANFTPLSFVSATDGRVRGWATSDRNGAFSVPFVAPGTYTLAVGGTRVRSFVVRPDGITDVGPIALR